MNRYDISYSKVPTNIDAYFDKKPLFALRRRIGMLGIPQTTNRYLGIIAVDGYVEISHANILVDHAVLFTDD